MANRENLISCLNSVLQATSSSGRLLEHEYVTISNDRIRASNGAIRIEAQLIEPLSGLTCAVHGKQLSEYLKSLDSESVDLEFNGDNLIVKSGKSKMQFVCTDPQKMDPIKSDESVINGDQNDLIDGLLACKKNAVKDKMLGPIAGVRIKGDSILSTNGARITKYRVDDTGIDCVVPVGFINLLGKHFDKRIELSYGKSMIASVYGEFMITIQSALLSGSFPDLSKFFILDGKRASRIELGDDAKAVMDRHASLVKSLDYSNQDSKFFIREGSCEITSKNSTIGKLEDAVSLVNRVQNEFSFILNPCLIVDDAITEYNFTYLVDDKYLVFESDRLTLLVQTREQTTKEVGIG